MKLITEKKQIDILDTYLLPNSVRIQVRAICNLRKIDNQYIIREKSFKKIRYYFQEIGLKNTVFKIMSRLRESNRNEKYFSIGVGKIVESQSARFTRGQIAYFFSCNHPACQERIVVSEQCVLAADGISEKFPVDKITWLKNSDMADCWLPLLSWSPYSGFAFPAVSVDQDKMLTVFFAAKTVKQFQIKNTPISEIKFSQNQFISKDRKRGVLFGLGNYAKTIILPNLNKSIALTAIHEIDPTQIAPFNKKIHYDTSPFPRNDKHYDVYFVAGYHHAHADIAMTGLNNNADVVIEKPIVTTKDQLQRLISAMKNSSGELYACFQRRYQRFNDFIFEDFKINKGDPISYYAIVYEETLPDLHWYRWPNSRSAIISNGCHWIDHFIFLNHFSPVEYFDVKKTKMNELLVLIELQNGALLSLTLSHLGSARIGMQDYIELRSCNSTIKISNSKHYFSENTSRVIRRAAINKFDSYKKMYQAISHNIVNKNVPRLSDPIEQLNTVSSLILTLDDMVMEI